MNRIKAFLITAAAGLGANLVWANGGHFAVDDASIMPGANCGVETWVSRVRSTNIATVNPQCNFTGGSEWALPLVYDLDSSELAYMGLGYKTVWLDRDRKSTRLNSSHVAISYAVFCLKKKKSREKTRH